MTPRKNPVAAPKVKENVPVPPPAMPGEFEEQDCLVFGAGQLIRFYPQLFVDFVRASFERVQLIGIVAPEYREIADLLLGTAGIPLSAVEYLEGKTSSVWARDWSPFMGYNAEGVRCQFYVDRSHMRHRDDEIARGIYSQYFNDPIMEIPLAMEGGNILSNGCGLVITSQTVAQTNHSRYTHNQIAGIFESHLGARQWAALSPLHAERTGHIDLFATFLAPDFLLLGSVDANEDEINHRALDDAAEKLRGLDISVGKLKVERIPMPSSRDANFRSYNNVIFANGVLFVPVYPQQDPKLDQRVLAMYREYVPDREVIGIDMRELAKKGGGLHCLSANIPYPTRRFSPGSVKVA